MTKRTKAIGNWGERKAETFLLEKGIQILEKNFRSPYGEVDIIARQGDILIFVEVKTRGNDALGYPEASITQKKKEHIVNTANYYLQTRPNGNVDTDWRVDVIAIRGTPECSDIEIEWFENAISE